MKGIIEAVCISPAKGVKKRPVDRIVLVENYGVKDDAHAGSGRQVSLLAAESVDRVRKKLPGLAAGDFAENILTRGLPWSLIAVGTRLRAADVELEVTQIGKECHQGCEIRRAVGYCIMPEEGVFARVLSGGILRPGDVIEIVSVQK